MHAYDFEKHSCVTIIKFLYGIFVSDLIPNKCLIKINQKCFIVVDYIIITIHAYE